VGKRSFLPLRSNHTSGRGGRRSKKGGVCRECLWRKEKLSKILLESVYKTGDTPEEEERVERKNSRGNGREKEFIPSCSTRTCIQRGASIAVEKGKENGFS